MSSPTWLKSAGEQGAREKPVGTGPFKFAEFKRDAYLKFERFDDYWGGKPHLDGVQYVFIPDAMIAQASFIAGEVDVLQNADVKTASDLSAKGYKAVSIIGGLTGLAPDFGRAGSIFTDIKVRQAIEYAIDKEAIVDTLGKGYFEAIYQFNAAGFQGYNPAIEGRKYDPDKAKALLTEAGHPDGISTTIYAIEMFAPRDAMASIQAYLADANINAKVEFVDVGRWNELRRKSGWDGLLFMHSGWSTNVPMMINYPLSKPRNDYVSAPRTDECEALLQKMLVTTDYNAQSAVLQQIEKLLYDQAWACPLWGRTATAVINDKKVHDSGINDFSVIDWTPALAWLGE
jgi:peptide/nickel transport system substrate-binding protein